MRATIIGVDCATQAQRIGLALGRLDESGVSLTAVVAGETDAQVRQTITNWIRQADAPVLLALDAPLGWPAALGQVLSGHQAGDSIQMPANRLFRRLTDQVIKEQVGKQSLDVGADRIARTALAALTLLSDVRHRLQQPIPLAWQRPLIDPVSAIEVYPAATLRAYGFKASGYKRQNGRLAREQLRTQLATVMDLPEVPLLLEKDDVLDAAVAVLAGADFLRGLTIAPTDPALARREGWMWVRQPTEEGLG